MRIISKWLKSSGKLWGFFFVVAAFVSPSGAQANMNFVLERPLMFKAAFAFAMSLRCESYVAARDQSNSQFNCRRGTAALVEAMDSTTLCRNISERNKSCGVIVFRTDLLRLLRRLDVYNYLRDLNERFSHMDVLPGYEIDLWRVTLSHAKSEDEAVRWLGTLFQDTAAERYHLQWLKKQMLSGRQQTVFAELSRALAAFRRHYHETNSPGLKVLPETVGDYGNGIYHFYVPALLYAKLVDGGLSTELSRTLPFLLNYLYEIQTTVAQPILHVVKEPSSIADPATATDIYLAYAAVTWPTDFPIPLPAFAEMLAADPTLVRDLF